MRQRHPVPALLLISDARNDAVLARALARLPRDGGLVFRHYHLAPDERRQRFRALRGQGRAMIWAGSARDACRAGAAGAYAAPERLGPCTGALRLATVHSLREMRRAVAAGADAVLLSPVFATRSHPGAAVLGPVRFLLLARACPVPVIALGGMDARRASRLAVRGWAAIDGLSR